MRMGTGVVIAGNEHCTPMFEDEVLMTDIRESGTVDCGVAGEGGEGCRGAKWQERLELFCDGSCRW